MPVSRKIARPHLTAAELVLTEESFAPALGMLSEADLRKRVVRARKLRDKYRDLAAKQTREIKGRARPTRKRAPTGMRGTEIKRAYFAETLARFEKGLAKFGAEAKKAKAKTALKSALANKKSASAPAPAGAPRSRRTAAPKPSKKAPRFDNLQTMRGASRAAHARAQARRDSR